jgi:hypothetical protein
VEVAGPDPRAGTTGAIGGSDGVFRVEKVYKGDVNAGAKIRVLISDLFASEEASAATGDKENAARPPALRWNGEESQTFVMFLTHEDRDVYRAIESGIKPIRHDEVFSFQPRGRFGPYYLRPQRSEFIADLAPGKPYTVVELRRDLMAAKERADMFGKCYDANDLAALEKYLPLLPFQQHLQGGEIGLAAEAAERIAEKASKATIREILARKKGDWSPAAVHIIEEALKTEAGNKTAR